MNLALAPLTHAHIATHALCMADRAALQFDQGGEIRQAIDAARLFSLGRIDALALRAAVLPVERRYAALMSCDDSATRESMALAAVQNACAVPLHPANYWIVRNQCAAVAG